MGAAELAVPAAVMDGKNPERFSNTVSPSIDRYSSVIARREEVDGFYIPESTCGNIVPYTELSRSSSQLSSSLCRDSPEELKLAGGIFSPLSISSLEGKQIRRRSGKMASSSSSCSKRSRMGQIEDITMNEEAIDVKEKSQIPKTKNGLNGKRVDRRNGKVSMKSKYDFFSLKAGMVTFNSGGGGSNSVGLCGLKPDAYDVTKHLDEITVKELLDGHYKDPSLVKDKGKRAAENLNENIVNSVRMASSILQRKKPVKAQCSADIDDTYNWNVSVAPACVSASNVDEKGDTCITDVTSHGKVPSKVLDFQLYQPKDILERIGLPLSVDLDALLMDAAKPVIFTKESLDYRGKQISQRASLATADAIKFSTSRSSCHGKWARIDNTADLFGGRSDFLAELDSLNYDPKLIPVKSMKYIPSANRAALCEPGGSTIDFCSSSTATCSRVSQLTVEYGGKLKHEENGEDSPRSLAAAQILCNIVKQFPKQEQHQRMTWASKPLDKTIKACRSKPDNKFGEISAKPESAASSHGLVKSKETSPIFKKSRLLINEKGKDLNTGTKGMVNWALPRSSTHSPSKPLRDNHSNLKSYNSFMMPPPSSKVFDKASNSRQKLR